MSDLLYRRQYILGKKFIDKYSTWKKIKISSDYYLTSHPDLSVEIVQDGDKQLTLLGFILDPYNPTYQDRDILLDLLKCTNNQEDLVENTLRYGGRWILIYSDNKVNYLLHDACGLRQVFYARVNKETWCASQPSLLLDALETNFEIDHEAEDFTKSAFFERTERAWMGSGTLYKTINHLLPNHGIALNECSINRVFPTTRINKRSSDEIIEKSKVLLKGTLEAANNRYNLMLAVTAGWDSRALLASSKDIKNDVYYYVDKLDNMDSSHEDIRVPKKLSSDLNFKLNVLDCSEDLDSDFQNILSKNVTLARTHLPKAKEIYNKYKYHSDKINVSGNCSEIARRFYYNFEKNNVDSDYLSRIEKYKNVPYVKSQLDLWLTEAYAASNVSGISIFDLLYWEQRTGNWGAMFPAEQDIAIEELCPFNNRLLLILLLSSDKKDRKGPKYPLYEALINTMWSESLDHSLSKVKVKKRLKNSLKTIYLKYL